MAKPSSTEIVLVGTVGAGVLSELDRLANVRGSAIDHEAGDSARALVSRSHTPYVVHDSDPLAALGSAWRGFFDEAVPAGTLEVAIQSTLGAFQRGEAAMPDYYVVLAPDTLTATERNWWFGALAGVSPSRVVPSGPTAAEVGLTISRLPFGRWWPEPAAEWIRSIDRAIPDDHALVRTERPDPWSPPPGTTRHVWSAVGTLSDGGDREGPTRQVPVPPVTRPSS